MPAVTFSHKRNKKLQEVNLQYKRVFWPEEQRWVRLRISARVRPARTCALCCYWRTYYGSSSLQLPGSLTVPWQP